MKTHIAHWLSFCGVERKVKGNDSNHVGFDAAALIGEPLHSEFLTADEGFYAGVNFALGVACHVLTDPFGDPSLLIEYEAKETRDWLVVIARDAEEQYDAEMAAEPIKETTRFAAVDGMGTMVPIERPPAELLERQLVPAGCAA